MAYATSTLSQVLYTLTSMTPVTFARNSSTTRIGTTSPSRNHKCIWAAAAAIGENRVGCVSSTLLLRGHGLHPLHGSVRWEKKRRVRGEERERKRRGRQWDKGHIHCDGDEKEGAGGEREKETEKGRQWDKGHIHGAGDEIGNTTRIKNNP